MSRLVFTFLTALLSITTLNVIARQDISLNEVVKINLTITPGGTSSADDFKNYEVTLENNKWNSYKLKNSLPKTFIKEIDQNELNRLLHILNTKDTSIELSKFNLQPEEMEVAFDSLNKTDYLKYTKIRPYQKKLFLETFNDKKQAERILRQILVPFDMDDKTAYKITIETKSGKQKVISSDSFANIYNLPWSTDDKKLYDPEISRIFASLTGDIHFDQQYKGFLYQRLFLNLFWKEFRTSFSWANLKEDYPSATNSLGSTLQINYCFKNETGYGIQFSSSLLPKNIVIKGGFVRPDTILMKMKLLEQRLVSLQQQKHYIFKFLKRNPDLQFEAIVNEFTDNSEIGPMNLKILKTKYKKLLPYTYDQLTLLILHNSAIADQGKYAEKWILLPDDTVIVIPDERSV
ncbi:hypothetical protein ACVWYN_002167 [Pedobacter sp. UYP24]